MADITRQQFPLRLPKDLLAEIDAVRTISRNLWFEQAARAALDPITVRVPEDEGPSPLPEEHQLTGPETKHLHRFTKVGTPVSFNKGQPIYRRVCSCGATKEE